MNQLTVMCAKPHVAQFITHKFSQGDIVKIPKDPVQLYTAVKSCTTTDFKKRLIDIPEGMQAFRAALPEGYHFHYLAQQEVSLFAKALEKYFWTEFEIFMYQRINNINQYKDHAIKDFQEMYGVNESLYPIGHFRRKLHRNRVSGLKPPLPEIKERLHPRIPDQICWQMYRVYRDKKISLRKLAEYYSIGYWSIWNIFQKIKSAHLSKSQTKSQTNTMEYA